MGASGSKKRGPCSIRSAEGTLSRSGGSERRWMGLVHVVRVARVVRVVRVAVVVIAVAAAAWLALISAPATFSASAQSVWASDDFSADDFPDDQSPEVDVHHNGMVSIDLFPGAERGSVTFPLRTGLIATTGQTAYFVLSDASDKDFCAAYGCIPAPSLEDTPEAALEDAEFDERTGEWTFHNDPGRVARPGGPNGILAPVANSNYSPLKRIQWGDETVIVNVPMVKWGDEPGQTMLIDRGGLDPLIRSHAPSPFTFGHGPPGATPEETAMERYKGAQLLDIDLENLTVTIKLHESVFSKNRFPHYVVWDASKGPAAAFMGTPHTPKTAAMGRFGSNDAVGNVIQYANGISVQGGGPNRFQPGLMSYGAGQSQKYSPMWHIHWLFYDMDGDGVFFDDERNVSRGAMPTPNSGVPRFDPANQATFNPFGMDDGGVSNPARVDELTRGRFVGYNDIRGLVKEGVAILTEGPPGLELDHPMQPPLIVNCPAPLTVRE